ncbi:PAS domain-containing protein [Streptomyces sp. NPDC096193]|uniref:PAS domain-containing protein n=1 Tax=Streptomyces sp. NPDC096193 TaxID=3155821 RepID=UPI00331C4407
MEKPDPTLGTTTLTALLEQTEDVAGAALAALLTRSAAGFGVWDTDLRCVWVNDTLGQYDGIARESRLGRGPRESLPGDGEELETAMRQVLATGAGLTGREYRVPAVAGTVRDSAYSASFVRLDDADGHPLGVCLVVLAVRDRRWAGDRLAVVSEAGARIGTTLDVMRTAQELADFTVPLLADYVTVDLTEAVRLGEEPLERLEPSQGRIPTFRRAGRASIHTGAPESLWTRGEVVYVPEGFALHAGAVDGRSGAGADPRHLGGLLAVQRSGAGGEDPRVRHALPHGPPGPCARRSAGCGGVRAGRTTRCRSTKAITSSPRSWCPGPR